MKPSYAVAGNIIFVQSLWEREFFQKIKNKIPNDPAIPFMSVCISEFPFTDSRKHMHPNVHNNIIYSCQDKEAICVHQQING